MATIEDVMEFLWSHRAANLPPAGLADVFDRLIWCTDDNGAGVLGVRSKWLVGDDVEKVRVALAMDETFPCDTRTALAALLNQVSERWPETRPACDNILSRWDEQHPPK